MTDRHITHAVRRRRGEERGGKGRGVKKYLEERRIVSAVVEATSPGICQGAQQEAFPFVFSARCCVTKVMWIYRLVVGLAAVLCCGKFFFSCLSSASYPKYYVVSV